MPNNVKVIIGDMFESQAQTITNTVNVVGVMGKGIALGFKKRFPAMYADYAKRCDAGLVRLGEPYLFKQNDGPWILNFPTKGHWRQLATIQDIETGLQYLAGMYKEWGIESLAVPPLGCGEGGLEWRIVGPTLYGYLDQLDIPIELYAPFGTPDLEIEDEFLRGQGELIEAPATEKLPVGLIALVEILNTVNHELYHPPVGRIMFQKIAYFATRAGIPTGLEFERRNFGPFAPNLKRGVSALVNNGLVEEESIGRMIVHHVGRSFDNVLKSEYYMDQIGSWNAEIDKVTDLVMRIRSTRQAELAASVMFIADQMLSDTGETPTEQMIVDRVLDWKKNRDGAPVEKTELVEALRMLQALDWMELRPSRDLATIWDELETA